MSDEEFLTQFLDGTLPFEQWTHRAHVRVAYLHLSKYRFPEALARIRRGIQAYNRANHVSEGPTSGYNETTTHAFTVLVAATMQAYGEAIPATDSSSFCDLHPQLMNRSALRFFYSPARREDPLAKTQFIEPDLAPLPRVRGDADV